MCGIFGIYIQNGMDSVDEIKLDSSIRKLVHRGPDNQSVKLIDDHIGLGHSRLSIIDLSDGANQPFEYKHLSLVFNGEIFNYLELREELQGLGYSFNTGSDTEVLIISYYHWGPEAVSRFNGMWSFAIYDKRSNLIFCSRDRFGIKPFNYCLKDGKFIFSSEVKAILAYDPELRRPNYNSIANYCRESVGAQSQETWFEDILRLPPGNNITVTRNSHEIKPYWVYPQNYDTSLTEEYALQNYRKLFEEAVRIRMRSDVPIGATLSSGLDSSAIVSFVNKYYKNSVNTYTASFPDETFDEFRIVKQFVGNLNVTPNQVVVEYTNYLDTLKQLIYHLESGHSSPAIFPLHMIVKRAKEDIRVFLEGQGADELLGGYIDNIIIDYLVELAQNGKWRLAFNELRAYSKSGSLSNALALFLRTNTSPTIRKVFRKILGIENIYSGRLKKYHPPSIYIQSGTGPKLNRKLIEQHQTGLVNLLHYGDAISMMHSLENRLPFMDYRLVEFGFSVPSSLKIKNGLGKYIHRAAVKDILPDYIVNNPIKQGFTSPLKDLFLPENQKVFNTISGESIRNRGLFNIGALEKLINKHVSGKRDYSRLLFRILCVELWFQVFIDQSFVHYESLNSSKQASAL